MPRSASSSGSTRALRPGEPAAPVPAMSKITSSRSPAAAQIRPPIFNGKQSRPRRLKTSGRGRVALVRLRLAVCRSPPCQHYGCRSGNTPAARANRALAFQRRIGQPSPRDLVRPDAGTPCTTRLAAHRPRQRHRASSAGRIDTSSLPLKNRPAEGFNFQHGPINCPVRVIGAFALPPA